MELLTGILLSVGVTLVLLAIFWLGRWVEWRQLRPMFDHHNDWMKAQEELNRSFSAQMYDMGLYLIALEKRTQAQRKEGE